MTISPNTSNTTNVPWTPPSPSAVFISNWRYCLLTISFMNTIYCVGPQSIQNGGQDGFFYATDNGRSMNSPTILNWSLYGPGPLISPEYIKAEAPKQHWNLAATKGLYGQASTGATRSAGCQSKLHLINTARRTKELPTVTPKPHALDSSRSIQLATCILVFLFMYLFQTDQPR